MFAALYQLAWRLAGASGVGYVVGGKRGAVAAAGATIFFSTVSPRMATKGIWYAAQSLRVGAPLATGGRSVVAFNPLAGPRQARGVRVGGVGAGAAVVGYTLGSVAGTATVWALEEAGLVQEGSTEDVVDLYIGFVVDPISTTIDFTSTIGKGVSVALGESTNEATYEIPSNNAAGILTYQEWMNYQMTQGRTPGTWGLGGFAVGYGIYQFTHEL